MSFESVALAVAWAIVLIVVLVVILPALLAPRVVDTERLEEVDPFDLDGPVIDAEPA